MTKHSAVRVSPRVGPNRRKGAVVVLAAFFLVLMLACVAFTFDLGYLFMVRGQAQNCADAAALAAAWELTGDDRIREDIDSLQAAAGEKAIEYAALQDVTETVCRLGDNQSNSVVSEVAFGHLDEPENHDEEISFADPDNVNTVFVRVECTPQRNTSRTVVFRSHFRARNGQRYGLGRRHLPRLQHCRIPGHREQRQLQRHAVRGQARGLARLLGQRKR